MMFFKDENPPIPVIMYDVAWDEATADEQQALKDLAFADNWNPKSGRPLDFPVSSEMLDSTSISKGQMLKSCQPSARLRS